MKLKILGSGTIISDKHTSNCSGYLLDDRLLFDCGPGVWRALNENRLSPTQINHILLSHFHVDHVSDLLPILLSRWMFKNERKNPVYIIGPQGIKVWFRKVINITTDWIKDLDIRVIENTGNDLQLLSSRTGSGDDVSESAPEDSSQVTSEKTVEDDAAPPDTNQQEDDLPF